MDQILRSAEVRKLTGLSRTTLWRFERGGDFPARRKLGERSVGWLASEVSAWLETREPANPASEEAAMMARSSTRQSS